ncbi:MAG: AMP-dependent synthetase and ligase [Frankiales bacterium]|nr:AMP-dependent synthetase and ligase [Frankiales bacterium]
MHGSAVPAVPSGVTALATDRRRARRQQLGDLLHRSAARFPDKLALVGGEERFTYAELDAVVNRLAHGLAGAGLQQGERLALLARNSWQVAALTFATARLGVVLVPVNFMLTAPEVAFILEHSGAVGLVVEDALLPVGEQALAAVDRVRVRAVIGQAPEGWTDVADWVAHPDATEPDLDLDDDAPLQLMYTSGTESRPKGVVMTSRMLVAQYVSCIVDGGMETDDVEVHSLPLYHCAQLHCFLVPDVYLGATSIVLPGADPAALLATIARERVTKLFAPPTVWISLLRHPDFDTTDLSSLRKGYYGASAMPVAVLHEMLERLPQVRLWNFYGQTEMAPVATILGPDEQLSHAGSAGRAVLNVETVVVDDDGVEVPRGEVGEIVHRSPHATPGYWEDDAKTAEAFAHGWFHSGDLGVVSESGHLAVVDRKKDMIKTGGENVASREVEEAVYQLDGVAEVAVFGVPHPVWIEAVTAVVVAKPGTTLTEEAVLAHCRGLLAGYKTPKRVVVADALPKNPSGKILKRELRATYGDA